MTRGDTYVFEITVLNYDGTAFDLTGASLRFTAKWDIRALDAAAVITLTTGGGGIVVTSATDGEATVTILPSHTTSLPSHTTKLVYDIQVYLSATQVYTVMQGVLTVVPDSSVTAP
jgi:hypothetical protein